MTALFCVRDITKRFGATLALDKVSLDIEAGRVNALLGANGAGKSTLIRILGGALNADSGSMGCLGHSYQPGSPASARAHGVVVIHQEPAIVPELSVEANVMLGCERSRLGLVNRSLHRQLTTAALSRLGYGTLNPAALGGDLSLPMRHVVAIARALVLEARVVVLDEPTSALSTVESEHVLAVVRQLAAQGVAVLYVTHFLDEVRRATDSWSVLRDGRIVASGDSGSTSVEDLIGHLSGRRTADRPQRAARTPGEVVLTVTDLSGPVAPRAVDLRVRRGEILGLYGVAGSGRSSLLRTIIGADRRARGTVRVGSGVALRAGALCGVRAGVALLPESRETEGQLPRQSVLENVTVSRLSRYARAGFLDASRLHAGARAALLDVAAAHVELDASIADLSGGMQQRIALARVLHQDPDVLLLDEPTRGLDVGTRPEIYRRLAAFAARGRAVVMTGSSVDDLLAECDTLGVMRLGRLQDVRPVKAWTRAEALAAGAKAAS
ncbi:MAG: sugar ABC transporter ATP-binding protein [Planctomycetes bacterium]|nr:sugar ABC transporter ATP-binding protein [Planctomycetota bacterium]